MHLITHPPSSRQPQKLKSGSNLESHLSVFVPSVSPPSREVLRSPGFSPLALSLCERASGALLEPSTVPLVNSSILRPGQPRPLASLLHQHQRRIAWLEVYRMDSVCKRQYTGLGLRQIKDQDASGSGGYFGPQVEQWLREKGHRIRPRRQRIASFSEASARRLHHQVRNAPLEVKSQFLLTYPADFPLSGKIVKNHLDRWFRAIRKAYGSENFGFEWVLEFQTKRGAPHFHVFFTWEPSNELRRFLAKKWNGIVKGGKKHLWFHLRSKNFVAWNMGKGGYVMKYAQKKEQKDVPENFEDVGRFWGCSRNMIPQAFNLDFERMAGICDWSVKAIQNYFLRALRKYHDGQLERWGKESRLHGQDWSKVKVPNTGQVVRQLLRYVYGNRPPPGDAEHREPLVGAVSS